MILLLPLFVESLSDRPFDDPDAKLPFIREILSSLRREIEGEATLLGFVGTPWTLAAYAIEGKADKNLIITKTMMMHGEMGHCEHVLWFKVLKQNCRWTVRKSE